MSKNIRYRRLKNYENEFDNMMEGVYKVHAGDQTFNKANLRNTIEKTMDGTKTILLEIIETDELLSNDGRNSVTGSGDFGVNKKTNCNADPPQWDSITLDSVQSNVGVGSQAEVTVATGGAGSQAQAKVTAAPAPAVTAAADEEQNCVLAFLERIGNKLKSFFQWLWGKIKQAARAVRDAVCTAFNTVWGWLQSAWAWMTEANSGSQIPYSQITSKCHMA